MHTGREKRESGQVRRTCNGPLKPLPTGVKTTLARRAPHYRKCIAPSLITP